MTPAEIRAAIAASPELQALAAERNDLAIAAALSEGRTKAVPTEIGAGTILETIGFAAGNALLDAINSTPDFRHVKPLIEQGRLRLDSPLVIGTLQALVGASVIAQGHANALIARARVADPVPVNDVSAALNEKV